MFGARLHDLRTNAGLTLNELAARYEARYHETIHKSTLSRYENGLQKPSLPVVQNLANLFSVSIDYLTGANPEQAPPTASASLEQLIHDLRCHPTSRFGFVIGCGGEGEVIRMNEAEYTALKQVLQVMRHESSPPKS